MNDQLVQLEALRKKAAVALICIIAGSIAALLISLVAVIPYTFNAAFFISMVLGIITGILISKITGYGKKTKAYRAYFKSLLVEGPFRKVFDEVSYHSDFGFSQEQIKETAMMLLGNRFYSNDLLRGSYKGVRFERADVDIKNRVSTGKSSHTVTYFNGRWLIFDFNKDFHFDLQIIGKGFQYYRHNNSIFVKEENRRHKIELEDIYFNENFDVYAQDDHEAFYILTPQFMAVLKHMYEHIDGDIMLGFVDNRLHVAINTKKDALEPPIFQSVYSSETNQDIQHEIEAITNIIDSLNLDRNLYSL